MLMSSSFGSQWETKKSQDCRLLSSRADVVSSPRASQGRPAKVHNAGCTAGRSTEPSTSSLCCHREMNGCSPPKKRAPYLSSQSRSTHQTVRLCMPKSLSALHERSKALKITPINSHRICTCFTKLRQLSSHINMRGKKPWKSARKRTRGCVAAVVDGYQDQHDQRGLGPAL